LAGSSAAHLSVRSPPRGESLTMAVVGLDIGDHSTYISLARQGGVDTIANDYTQRATPTIVALGGRQRFMGVSAENQRNLTVKNTVSYFKNFLGRKYKDEYVQRMIGRVGAEVVELQNEQVGFRVQGNDYRPEQLLAMMFTKVKEIVRQDQGEEIATCVVSVPVYFTETQRSAVLDAGKVAGLPIVQLMNDTSALALAYGKTKSEELEDEEAKQRYVVLVDVGASGIQSSLVGISKRKAKVLGTSWSNNTGGSSLDVALRAHIVAEIEKKYKVKLEGNSKALNKLGIAVEKVKKQMSANSNKLPMQIDSLVDDVDVNISVDRATFEQLACEQLEEVRGCLLSLLQATTVRREQLHSVELVGGAGRMPAVKQIVQEVFGIAPTSSLNADEAVSKGCGLQAASQSDKFRTKKFEVQEVVSRGVEAVYVHDGNQEKVLVCDEGDNGASSRSLSIRADLPVSVALQYAENVPVDNRFIALYQIESDNMKNADLELGFKLDKNGMIKMEKVQLLTKEASKRRRTSEGDNSAEGSMVELRFTETSLGGFPSEVVAKLREEEEKMQQEDTKEVARQEAKNMLEEQLYKYRAAVVAEADQLEKEQAFQQIKEYFDQTENWLYEEGEDAPQQTYEGILKSFHDKMGVFQMWKSKYLQMKAREEEKRQFLEVQAQQQQQQQQQQRPRTPTSRQIPVVYEGEGPYVRSQHPQDPQCAPRHPSHGDHGYSRPVQAEPFTENSDRGQRLRRPQLPEDPFNGFRRSSFFNDPLFGW